MTEALQLNIEALACYVFVLYAYAEPGSEANALMLFSWPLTMKSLVRPDAMMY